MSELFPFMFIDEGKDVDVSVLQAIAVKKTMEKMLETSTIMSSKLLMGEQTYKDIYNWARAAQLCKDIEKGLKDEGLEECLTHEYSNVRQQSLARLKLIKQKGKKNGSKALKKNHSKKSVVGKVKKDGT